MHLLWTVELMLELPILNWRKFFFLVQTSVELFFSNDWLMTQFFFSFVQKFIKFSFLVVFWIGWCVETQGDKKLWDLLPTLYATAFVTSTFWRDALYVPAIEGHDNNVHVLSKTISDLIIHFKVSLFPCFVFDINSLVYFRLCNIFS
jgi:hypothetical protein